jgi:rubrerythrin
MAVNPIEKVLDFAIANEQQAVRFYTKLADQAARPPMRQVFLDFADEERRHEAALREMKLGKRMLPLESEVQTLGLADNLRMDVINLSEDMDYQQALILAMKSEKAAFRLYQKLSEAVHDPGVKELFLRLAQEEARHKLRFEIEYDDAYLTED